MEYVTSDKLGEAEIKLKLGTVLIDLGEYDQSSTYLFDALMVFEDYKKTAPMARTLISIGRIYRRQNLGDKALGMARESLMRLAEQNHSPDSALAYGLIGLVYMDRLSGVHKLGAYERAQIDSSRAAFEIALEISRRHGDVLTELNSLHYVASMHHALKENERARALWKEVIRIAEKQDALRYKCYAVRGLGGNYAYNDQCDLAIDYFLEARRLARVIGDAKIYAHVTDNLATCYSMIDDFEKAYEYSEQYALIKDSISQKAYSETIAELETAYKTESKEQQIQILTQEAKLNTSIMIGGGIASLLIISFAWIYYRKRQEQQNLHYEKQLMELEQKALHLQMNPHFIFNSLSAIQGYISEKNHKSARNYLSMFARLMRMILECSRVQSISLETEIELLRHYLELSHLRFENAFEYKIDVEKLEVESIGIPPMMIQPFVENAIIHGVVPLSTKGQIHILFTRVDELLQCIVTDNGVGRMESGVNCENEDHRSLAMQITRERLDLVSGLPVRPTLKVEDLEIGTRVVIELPIVSLWE